MARKYRQPIRSNLSISEVRSLAWNAVNNDPFSFEILESENRRLAKIANSRLRALEASGYDMFAYDRAITYLQNRNKTRFSTKLPKPDRNYEEIVNQMSELINFINVKTSTVAGAKKALHDKVDKISEFTGHEYTEDQEYRLGRLLGTDSISQLLREVRGDSAEVIEVIEEASMSDVNVQQLASIIDRHLAGYDPFGDNTDYLDYDEMMFELREELERQRNGD